MAARLVLLLIAAGALIVAVPSSAHGGTVAPVACGATITVDTRLGNDLSDCPGIGIVIGADDVRLNLNGHVVDGDGIGDSEGIQVQGHRGITIENGSVRDFVEGVAVLNARQTSVRRLSLSAHRHTGVFVSDSRDVAVEETKSTAIAFPGVFITRSHNVFVGRNVVSRSGSGIGVRMSDHVHVAGNTVSRNTCEGIFVADGATDNVIEDNSVSGNRCDGITLTNGSDPSATATARKVAFMSYPTMPATPQEQHNLAQHRDREHR
jgi:parallel beta-helix repeat protein